MKKIMFLFFLFITAFVQAQVDSVKVIEPEMETSYDNKDLLLISFAGLAILLSIYFLFKRVRGKR